MNRGIFPRIYAVTNYCSYCKFCPLSVSEMGTVYSNLYGLNNEVGVKDSGYQPMNMKNPRQGGFRATYFIFGKFFK
jgi:hypothetical protein